MWFLLFLLCQQLADAALTFVSITPASLDAGVTGTVDVAFTMDTTIPVGGVIEVVFPTTFHMDSSSVLSNPMGFDPSSTLAVTTATGMVIITIATTDALAGGVSFTLDSSNSDEILLQGLGLSSNYWIRTKSASGTILESTPVVGSTFSSWTMSHAATVTAASQLAGRKTSYTVTWTTDIVLRVGSEVGIKFPVLSDSTIDITGATLAGLVGIDAASTELRVSSPYLILAIAGQDIAAGDTVSITYSNIINAAARSIPPFYVDTRYQTGAIFQVSSATNTLSFTSTTLPSATITPVSHWAGVATTYNVVFANLAYLPSGSRVEVTFPSRFEISGTTMSYTLNLPTVNTLFSLSGADTAKITLGNTVMPGVGRTISLENIINPGTSCDQFIVEYCLATWESYTLSIRDSGGNVFEASTTITGTPIVKKPLLYGRIRPFLKTPNTLTTATVTLDTATITPLGGYIEVEFPSDYSVGVGTITASSLINIPVTSSVVSSTSRSVKLQIADANIAATTGISFTVNKITTPSNHAVGTFAIRTQDAAGNTIEESNFIGGEGCLYLNDCNGHGTCTLLSKTCICETGWSAPTDVADYKSPDCSTRVCPSNYAWSSIPSGTTVAHDILVECSGMGICDRRAGTCTCFPGFEGSACERMGCPNDCSHRGTCLSMRDMAAAKNANPISSPTTYDNDPFSSSWDSDRIYGCVCDSSWAVGTASGELQATEYFGADCSNRHCPIGDDPDTAVDETDCQGKTVPGGNAVGLPGNKCLVECSNRGVCDYKAGTCICFQGYTGFACQTRDTLAN
ncbi:putative EGF-like domain-containing protein [Plasmopara halstedii]